MMSAQFDIQSSRFFPPYPIGFSHNRQWKNRYRCQTPQHQGQIFDDISYSSGYDEQYCFTE